MNSKLHCNYFSTANCFVAEIPAPPEDIEQLMEEYNRMLSMIYKRNTTKEEISPISTRPYQLPELTASEKRLLKEIEDRMKASKGYGEYKTQRRRWEILM